jgi:VCBS repeat-containing protein
VSLNESGMFQYTPQQDFHGADQFTYKVGDTAAESEAATVSITVEPVNDTPRATPDAFSTVEGTPIRVSAPGVLSNDRDVENDPLTARVSVEPEHGTLTLSADGSFQYVPQAGFSGTDRFTYEVHDASNAAKGIVTISVAGMNDAPSSKGIADVIHPDPTVPVAIDLNEVFEDADADPLSYTVEGNSEPNWVAATITDAHTLQLHFAGSASGTAEVRIRATDPAGEFAEETIRVKVPSGAKPVDPGTPEGTQIADRRLAALTTAIELDPQNSDSWKARARRYGELGRWQNAVDDLSQALALNPSDRGAWTDRGSAHAELGHWQAAQTDFAQAIAIEPDAPDTAYVTYLQALAALGANDLETYRGICARALGRAASAADSNSAIWTAWTCALAPEATAEFRQLVERTGPIAAGNRSKVFATVALGTLYFRAGRFDRAREFLQRTADRASGSGPLPYDWFFLAMTYERLGRSAEAAQWMSRASLATESLLLHGRNGAPLSWNQSLTLELLRREAETSISRGELP